MNLGLRTFCLPEEDPEIRRRIRIAPPKADIAARSAAVRGLYRIFNDPVFRFYRSNVSPPAESDTPFVTSASLPNQPSNTYANGTWYLSMSYFNGVIDSGFLPIGPHGETYIKLVISGGVAVPTAPSPPLRPALVQRAGGVVEVTAFYTSLPDGSNAATEWAITYTTNGSTPGTPPAVSPTITATMVAGPLKILARDLPAQTAGTVVKVRVQTRRTISPGVYSYSDSTVESITVVTAGASAPLSLGSWPGILPEDA